MKAVVKVMMLSLNTMPPGSRGLGFDACHTVRELCRRYLLGLEFKVGMKTKAI